MADIIESVVKEKFDIGKLMRGFLPTGANMGKWIQIIVIAGLIQAGTLVGQRFLQSRETSHQTAENITNIEQEEKGFKVFSLELFKWNK